MVGMTVEARILVTSSASQPLESSPPWLSIIIMLTLSFYTCFMLSPCKLQAVVAGPCSNAEGKAPGSWQPAVDPGL